MSCSHHAPAAKDASELPSIIVNGTVIKEEKLASELQYYPSATLGGAVQQAAYALIVRELLLQKARSLGFDESSMEEALIESVLDQEVDYPSANEDDCRRYFDANKKTFTSTAILEVSHILLASPEEEHAERTHARELAQRLIDQLQENPELFTALVEQHSACPSKETVGNLGQLSKGQTTPEFERQVFALPEGLAQKPVESRYGLHVVRVDRKIEGEQLPFDAVRERIDKYLTAVVRRKSVSNYLRRLAKDADISGFNIQIDDDTLELVL